jgi:putative nucleotidyltransferase with HDIG domain
MVCDKKNSKSFAEDDISLLNNVALQTAVAIKNFKLNEDAEKTYLETITALALAVEAKDPYSKGHLDRVSNYAEQLARRLELDEESIKALKSGSILHDIGKIGIRDEILGKPGKLTEEERKEMQDHVIIGVNIIKPIRSMSSLVDMVRSHQEWYDGNGYPDGLKGDEIPVTARILKICDAFDAMTTDRPYHKGMSEKEAKEELQRKAGAEFDPKIVKEFLKII